MATNSLALSSNGCQHYAHYPLVGKYLTRKLLLSIMLSEVRAFTLPQMNSHSSCVQKWIWWSGWWLRTWFAVC